MPHDMAKNIKMHIFKKYFKEIKEEKGCGILA